MTLKAAMATTLVALLWLLALASTVVVILTTGCSTREPLKPAPLPPPLPPVRFGQTNVINAVTDPPTAPPPSGPITNIGTYSVHLTNRPILLEYSFDLRSWVALGWMPAGDGYVRVNNGFTNNQCFYRTVWYTN